MYLIEKDYFGCHETTSLHKLLVVAFKDFKSFQRSTGIRCSQTKFVPNFVWKEKKGAIMAHKGYNGRVIAFWLADCLQRAVNRTVVEDRHFGQWLQQDGNWPREDDLLAPTAVAMRLF
ncbi:unnamed protein product [Symbiodinium necroappetens]|uniref:Uncharacterized protein n=1 Tax=Symbiodinium necroappetens TaxID=1628268 RepID=A0A813AJW8_9DINO|nr:unnamed protein product [Symbiodinium necroappetens]